MSVLAKPIAVEAATAGLSKIHLAVGIIRAADLAGSRSANVILIVPGLCQGGTFHVRQDARIQLVP